MKIYWRGVSFLFLLISITLLAAGKFDRAMYTLVEAVLFALWGLYGKDN